MPAPADYTLIITNSSGSSILCDPIGPALPAQGKPGHSLIEMHPRHLEAGTGSFTVAADPGLMPALFTPDARVVVRRALEDGSGLYDVEMAGPIELPENGFDITHDGAEGPGTITVAFTDDVIMLADRTVLPNPAQQPNAQTVAQYAVTNVNPETAIWDLVDKNAGPTALVNRRTQGMLMAVKKGLASGFFVTKSFTRDWILADAMRELNRLAIAGGVTLGIGWRIVQTATGLQFETFAPTDRSNSVVFSRPMGNIATLKYGQSAPTGTVAFVGDATAGVGRIIQIRTNAAAAAAGWRRREMFVDARGAVNATERDKEGDRALAEAGPKVRGAVTAIETPQTRYGYDYVRGDRVSYQPYIGGPFVSATVLGADIVVTPDRGEKTTPVIGTDDDVLVDAKAAEIRKLWSTISRMQGAL